MLMLPFAKSDLNGLVLGQDLLAVISVLPIVFEITLVGFSAIMLGGTLWRIHIGLGICKYANHLLNTVPKCSMMLMSSRSILVFQSLLCLTLQMLILAFYFAHNGFGFDLRAYTLANPALRPVALVISAYSVVLASHCLARYSDKKELTLLACTLFLTLGMIFFGARSNILVTYINVFLCYLVKLRTKVGFFRLLMIISVIVVLGLYLGNVRAGEYSLGAFFGTIAAALLFGDNFSDLRDFAWVYAKWDHVFWVGKTYLAAVTSFVPRFASQFRDTWGLGVATATTVGFDPQVHPGLRPGLFGEGYFNFGIFGVVLVGLLLGVVVRKVDTDVKSALDIDQPSIMKAFSSTMLLGVAGSFALTAGFSGLYILFGIYGFSWICIRAMRLVRPRRVVLASVSLNDLRS